MSLAFNQSGQYVPVRERREVSGILASNNAEVVLDVNGDESALVYCNGGAPTFTGTLNFFGSVNGVNYFPILALPYSASGGATAAQPLLLEAINQVNAQRVYALKCGQLRKVRVALTPYTTGSLSVTVAADTNDNIHPSMFDGRPTSLMISATGSAGAAATATLPLVAGLRHYIDFINITKFAAAALTAAATPVLVTTTNLPSTPSVAFPADAAAQGTDVVRELDFGGTGLAASLPNAATSVVAPATTNVIWRINVGYRIGL